MHPRLPSFEFLGHRFGQQAELKRQQDEAERVLEQAREVARAAIYAKYEPRQEAATQVPHFLVFWLLTSAAVWFVLSLLQGKGFELGAFLPSCFPGFFIGYVLQAHYRDKKRKSKSYIGIESARDAELAAVAERRDVRVMMSYAKTAGVTTSPTQTPMKATAARASDAVVPLAVSADNKATQPRWLAAAARPCRSGVTASQPSIINAPPTSAGRASFDASSANVRTGVDRRARYRCHAGLAGGCRFAS
ncbi:hypothetical protein [Paraburkholderia hospita]|uniref:hypothetical protein n=1 Tax=Paraburkholderia hospita TaxID=169430 RepID=UPI00103D7B4A|nr:hypothetical protein [Paraburkholderia hospita]